MIITVENDYDFGFCLLKLEIPTMVVIPHLPPAASERHLSLVTVKVKSNLI